LRERRRLHPNGPSRDPHAPFDAIDLRRDRRVGCVAAKRATFPDKPPLLIALSGNVMRLAAIHGNSAFDLQFRPPSLVQPVRLMTSQP